MDEPGDLSPAGISRSRPLLVAAGLAAAAVLGFLGLYQGFSMTWRPYPQLRSGSAAAVSPSPVIKAAPVAVNPAPILTPVSDRRPSPRRRDDAAAPPPMSEPEPAQRLQALNEASDAAASTPSLDPAASRDPGGPPVTAPPSTGDDDAAQSTARPPR